MDEAEQRQVRLVYVAGSGRSGSTLVALALASIDGWMTVGEVRMGLAGFLRDDRCGCGARFRTCPFWTAVMTEAFGGFDADLLGELLDLQQSVAQNRHTPLLALPWPGAGFRRRLDRLSGRLARLYAAVQRVSGATVIVDSSKTPAFFYAISRAPDIVPYVAHVVRDSRAVAFSNLRKVGDPAAADRVVYMPRQDLVTTSVAWDLKNLWISEIIRRRWPVVTVRYEDFVSEPDRELRRVVSMVEPQRPFRSPFAHGRLPERVHHTAGGNPMRFRQGELAVRPDEEWRTRMKGGQRHFVTWLTWPVLNRYGYLSAAGRPG